MYRPETCAFSALTFLFSPSPGALPQAFTFRAFGAANASLLRLQLSKLWISTESLEFEKTIAPLKTFRSIAELIASDDVVTEHSGQSALMCNYFMSFSLCGLN